MSLQKVLIIGASGTVGSAILPVLLADSSFTLSVLSRKSSKAAFPPSVTVHIISDEYPYSELMDSFKGADAVINAVGTEQVSEAVSRSFVDAAIEAGVKRYMPSEFGLNNEAGKAREVGDIFVGKANLLEYLKSKEGTSLTWTGLAIGTFLDWTFDYNFLEIDVKNHRVTYWDDGKALFSCTTLYTSAVAIKQILLAPEKTANKYLLVSNFATNQRSIVASLEKLSGKTYAVEHVSSKERVKGGQQALAKGDPTGVYDIIRGAFFAGGYGANLEEDGEVANGWLGVPEASLDEIVKKAIEKYN